MQFSYDRFGFPLIMLPTLECQVHLLPVTKIQFERFLAEANNDFGDTWYEQVLAINPRVGYRHLTPDNREQLFMTGILPEEAQAFASWMGAGFDLPTVDEWRAIYKTLAAEAPLLHHLLSQSGANAGHALLKPLFAQFQARSCLELSLMYGGVVKWARQGNKWVGLGAPRPTFQPNLWHPLSHDVKPIRPRARVPYFGFRLVRRWGW